MSTRDQVSEMRREIGQLRSQLAKRPTRVKGGGSATPIMFLRMIDGQTLFNSGGTTIYGTSRAAGTTTTVTSLWDPTAFASTAGLFAATAGIGRAALITDGVESSTLVLVCHDTRSGSLITQALVEGDVACTVGTVTLTLASDATQSVTAYLPLYI